MEVKYYKNQTSGTFLGRIPEIVKGILRGYRELRTSGLPGCRGLSQTDTGVGL